MAKEYNCVCDNNKPALTSESLVTPDGPGHEQRISVTTHTGGCWGLQAVELAVQDIKTKVTHLGFADAEVSVVLTPGAGVLVTGGGHDVSLDVFSAWCSSQSVS